MGFYPWIVRQLPLATQLSGNFVKLTPPHPASQGGDGWAGALFLADGGTAAAPSVAQATPVWSSFESTAAATDDRFNGLLLKTQGTAVRITNYTAATGTFDVTPSLPAAPTAGDLVWIQADLPLQASKIKFTNTGAVAIRWSFFSDVASVNGNFMTISDTTTAVSIEDTLFEETMGTSTWPIFLISEGAALPVTDDGVGFFVYVFNA